MATLFACTRCHSRHPAEELSEGYQLCKNCLTKKDARSSSVGSGTVSVTMNKCSYCRSEFPHEEKASKSVCKKCSNDLKVHGEPKACEYCNLLAAFGNSKCYRCQHSEKKYGPPQPCHQCKQKCAFDKHKEKESDSSKKLMCWLCVLSYKRVLERTGDYHKRKAQEESHRHKRHKHHHHHHHKHHEDGKHHGDKHHGDKHHGDKHHKHHSHHHHHSGGSGRSSSGGSASAAGGKSADETKSREQRLAELTTGSGMESKRLKLDTAPSPSNGVATPSRLLSDLDPSSTDHVIALQQLKDQVDGLKKQLKEKDQQLIEKEKKLTELKAGMYESEKELRNKLQQLQKKCDSEREENMAKNRTLQKQIATLTKLNKNVKSSRQSTPTTSP